MSGIKACPFCGSKNVMLLTECNYQMMHVYASCQDCGSSGERIDVYECAKRGMGLPESHGVVVALETAIEQAKDSWDTRS